MFQLLIGEATPAQTKGNPSEKTFAEESSGKAPAAPGTWSFETIFREARSGQAQILKSSDGSVEARPSAEQEGETISVLEDQSELGVAGPDRRVQDKVDEDGKQAIEPIEPARAARSLPNVFDSTAIESRSRHGTQQNIPGDLKNRKSDEPSAQRFELGLPGRDQVLETQPELAGRPSRDSATNSTGQANDIAVARPAMSAGGNAGWPEGTASPILNARSEIKDGEGERSVATVTSDNSWLAGSEDRIASKSESLIGNSDPEQSAALLHSNLRTNADHAQLAAEMPATSDRAASLVRSNEQLRSHEASFSVGNEFEPERQTTVPSTPDRSTLPVADRSILPSGGPPVAQSQHATLPRSTTNVGANQEIGELRNVVASRLDGSPVDNKSTSAAVSDPSLTQPAAKGPLGNHVTNPGEIVPKPLPQQHQAGIEPEKARQELGDGAGPHSPRSHDPNSSSRLAVADGGTQAPMQGSFRTREERYSEARTEKRGDQEVRGTAELNARAPAQVVTDSSKAAVTKPQSVAQSNNLLAADRFSDETKSTFDTESGRLSTSGALTGQVETSAPLRQTAFAALRSPDLPRHVAEQLATGFRAGSEKRAEILLNPAELGRVRINLQTGDTGVFVNVIADRPETLDLLRRNADVLAQEFNDIGYDSAEFSFGQGANPQTQQDRESDDGARWGDTGVPENAASVENNADAATPQIALDRVDIRL